MIDEVKKHLKAVEAFSSKEAEAIESFRVSYAGKKGILNELFAAFRTVPNEEKKAYSQELNALKSAVQEKVQSLQGQLYSKSTLQKIKDPTRTPFPIQTGNRHPLSVVKNRIIDIDSYPKINGAFINSE